MTILNTLASALNRRDEAPNQALAQEIVRTSDKGAIGELVKNLSNKNKNIQSDCIKVLYEIGERKPDLIASYHKEFGKLLESDNNRLAWGAMTALDAIAFQEPTAVRGLLPKILAAANRGSVITRDHAVGILVKLGSLKQYAQHCFPLLIEQLKTCPHNQLPMYAEMSAGVVTEQNRKAFHKILTQRLPGLEESQKKRLSRVLKRLMSTDGRFSQISETSAF
jgi:hypothetical protein